MRELGAVEQSAERKSCSRRIVNGDARAATARLEKLSRSSPIVANAVDERSRNSHRFCERLWPRAIDQVDDSILDVNAKRQLRWLIRFGRQKVVDRKLPRCITLDRAFEVPDTSDERPPRSAKIVRHANGNEVRHCDGFALR